MTNKPTDQKEKLSLGKTLTPKKDGATEQVRQSFSHGRSKTVSVEVKKKWGNRPQGGLVKKDSSLQKLTQAELDKRLKALEESVKQQSVEAQQRATREEQQRILLGNLQKRTEESQQEKIAAAQEAKKAEEAKVAQEEVASKEEKAISVELTKENTKTSTVSNAVAEEEIVPDMPTTYRADANPTLHPAKVLHKAKKALDDDDDEEFKKDRSKSPKTPVVKNDKVEVKRGGIKRLSRNVLTQALEGDELERTRSLASIKRARQKDKMKNQAQKEAAFIVREVQVPEFITVQELSNRMAVRGAEVIKFLMKMGVMATINQTIDADTAELVCNEFGHTFKRTSDADIEIGLRIEDSTDAELVKRPPIVTVMGHVDHGKTSLLDAIRKTDVVAGEAGGITQHIGAYQITMKSGQKITFIDTPGHAAFTEMRSRGANVTDIVVLVVAADDGIMEQTIEAVNHAKAANVPVVVAINKIDKPDANPQRVRSELLQHGIVLEEFGGEVLAVEVSAKTGLNLDKLEEAILLQAEVLDLKAPVDRVCEGVVVEAKVDKGRGNVATVLVRKGTLQKGDIFVAGSQWGKVRALVSDHGGFVQAAYPAMPVEVLGFNGVPQSGDEFFVVESEAKARDVTEYRQHKHKEALAVKSSKSSMERLMSGISSGQVKNLPVVIKADVHGSLEAIIGTLNKLSNDEVSIQVLHSGVGAIHESDISLAKASGAFIVGFNVRATPQARELAQKDQIDIRYYSIIYDIVDDVKVLLSGLLAPTLREKYLGQAEIREVFNVSKVGRIAGCMVTTGLVKRGVKVRLLRDNVVIHEGDLKTLRRFKDEAKEVKEGFECGMAFENYQDIKVGDVIECYEIESIAREI